MLPAQEAGPRSCQVGIRDRVANTKQSVKGTPGLSEVGNGEAVFEVGRIAGRRIGLGHTGHTLKHRRRLRQDGLSYAKVPFVGCAENHVCSRLVERRRTTAAHSLLLLELSSVFMDQSQKAVLETEISEVSTNGMDVGLESTWT